MSVTSELLYRFTFIIELHYISLSKVSLCEWVLRDRSRWIVGHWNSWPSSVNFLNYGGPEGQHTKIFHKKRSTVAGVLSKHTHKKRCYPTFSVNWNVVCALTVRGRRTKPNQTIITEWAAELTSYDQSQSVGQDTDIGQQIQEHNKLRERRNVDVIVKLNHAITQWAPVMWRGRLYCHWESTPPLCTKQKDIIWFNNVGNFSQSCPHTPKKLIHGISSLYIVVSVVILWSHSDLDRVDDAVDENQAFDFCHTECDQQHRLFHQHHRLLICQGAVIVQIRPEDRDARTLKSTKSWVHVGNSQRWGGETKPTMSKSALTTLTGRGGPRGSSAAAPAVYSRGGGERWRTWRPDRCGRARWWHWAGTRWPDRSPAPWTRWQSSSRSSSTPDPQLNKETTETEDVPPSVVIMI